MTATILENDLDIDDLSMLDFAEALPCEAADGECENEADYRLTMKCCGKVIFVCEDCLFEFIEHRKAMAVLGLTRSRCMNCAHQFKRNEFPMIVTSLGA